MVIGRNHIFGSLTVDSDRRFALLAPVSFQKTTAADQAIFVKLAPEAQ
jgi:hypothetical protein